MSRDKQVDEELENYYCKVEKEPPHKRIIPDHYYFVPTEQLYCNKIITALEPQAMYGLINYSEFEYLIKNDYFSILRVE